MSTSMERRMTACIFCLSIILLIQNVHAGNVTGRLEHRTAARTAVGPDGRMDCWCTTPGCIKAAKRQLYGKFTCSTTRFCLAERRWKYAVDTSTGKTQKLEYVQYSCPPDRMQLRCDKWEEPYISSPSRCCRDTNFCNRRFQLKDFSVSALLEPNANNSNGTNVELKVLAKGKGAESAGPPQSVVVVVAVLASLVGVGLVAALAMTLARHRRRRRKCVEVNVASPRLYTTAMLHSEITSCDSGCIMGESSGRGELQLEERTISREIELREQIGTGRFGEVYRGMWKENEVAVKIFKTIEQASFYQEVDLFNTCMLRHQNILGFRAADNRDFNMELQLWMVLDYHCHGSLYDYLRRHSTQNPSPNRKWLGRDDLHKLALSVSAGLMHLHNHIDGQSFGNKPGIAHRDLKTKNILVKQDGTCCIADLGMAVRNCPSQNSIQYMDKTNLKVGTKRYMAPEILDDSINYEKFASFRRVDIYALALVLWEIMTVCCPAPGELPTYKFPFEESVPGDPSVEDMHAVVCTRKLRPAFPSYWTEDKSLGVILRIIRMSWKEQPHSRFSANRVWRNLHPSEPVTSDSMLSPE